MPDLHRQDPRTAAPEHSIWRDIGEEIFRKHLVMLEERTNAVPVQPQVFPLACSRLRLAEKAYSLPLEIEHKLANDVAFIAATGEGAQSVSAVCIEERSTSSLCFRIAAIDAVDEKSRQAFEQIGGILTRLAIAPDVADKSDNADLLLRLIVQQHFQKLLGRLRSAKWPKPRYLSRTHKKSLWQDFDNLTHRVQFVYPKRKEPLRPATEARIRALGTQLEQFEHVPAGSSQEFTYLLTIIQACYDFCYAFEARDFACKLNAIVRPTPQIANAIKTLRQIEKIGAYQRIAIDLLDIVKRFPTLFQNVRFEYILPYSPIETEIGFEEWARCLHVHAEIQLLVYYDVLSQQQSEVSNQISYRPPRLIGTSKDLCYLCYLFLLHHGTFHVSSTHGRLYDQWTIPDIKEFNGNTRQKYRDTVAAIDSHVVEMSDALGLRGGKRDAWRVEPMTSRQNLLLNSDLAAELHKEFSKPSVADEDNIDDGVKEVEISLGQITM